jgi:hypothetical protein
MLITPQHCFASTIFTHTYTLPHSRAHAHTDLPTATTLDDATFKVKASGTIPVVYNGNTYHIPLAFCIDQRHPYVSPKVGGALWVAGPGPPIPLLRGMPPHFCCTPMVNRLCFHW